MLDMPKAGLPATAPVVSMLGVPTAGPGVLWPNGVGITDRPQTDDACGCPPCVCMCCARPIWYTDASRTAVSDMVEWKYGCCMEWHVDNPNILGVPGLSFHGRIPCCGCTQYVDVTEQGRKVGHVALYQKCACSQTIMAEAFDANGVSKFARIDNPCNPVDHFSGDHCGWGEHNWPIMWTPNQQAGPIAHMTYRRHCCVGCYPSWTGIRQMPAGAPPEDQKLLLAMVHARYWRTEQEQQNQNNGGN